MLKIGNGDLNPVSDPLAAEYERFLAAQKDAEKVEMEQREQDERSAAAQACSRLASLLGHPGMEFFLANYLRPKVQAEHDAALDPKNGKDGCWEACQRHSVAKEMAEMLRVEHDRAQAVLSAILEREKGGA